MAKKKKSKAKKKLQIDLHAWVVPFGGARHWESMIGEVISLSARKTVTVVFRYKRDGTPLPKTEQWEFPVARLKLVPDFRARVMKHAASAPSQGQANVVDRELVELTAEEYIPENLTLNPEGTNENQAH